MTTTTLRPDTTRAFQGTDLTVDGAASAHLALSDDSDASYVEQGDSALCSVTVDPVILTGITKAVEVRMRYALAAGALGTQAFRVSVGFDPASIGDNLIDAQLVTATTTAVATQTVATAPFMQGTQAQADALAIAINGIGGWNPLEDIRHYEWFLDIITVDKPVTVLQPLDASYTASGFPIDVSSTVDADGGPVTLAQVYITDDNDGDAIVYDTGVIGGAPPPGWVVYVPYASDFTVHARTGQTVNGAEYWSDYVTDTTTVTLATSDVASVVPVAVDSAAKIGITVNRDPASALWNYMNVQRSTDDGVTWEDVRGSTWVYVFGTGDVYTCEDHEPGNGQPVLYRARATALSLGYPVYGPWTESDPAVSWNAPDCLWIKCPNDPTLNAPFTWAPPFEPIRRPIRQGRQDVLGAEFPVMTSDVRQRITWAVTVQTQDATEQAALEALLNASAPLQLAFDPDRVKLGAGHAGVLYVSVGDVVEMPVDADYLTDYRRFRLPIIEVAVPGDPTASSYDDYTGHVGPPVPR